MAEFEVLFSVALTNAYLVAKEGGAMPIPYRCLSGEQRARLEELLSNAGHGATAA
jgi:hypothetical protein